MQDWPWLDILGVVAAAIALLIALRANAHSKHANKVAEQANKLAERSVRASKLSSVERVLEAFRKLVPKLRESPTGRIKQVDRLAQDARVIGSESLGLPFDRLRAALQQLPPRRARGKDSWGHPRSANRPVSEEDWATVQECIEGVYTALEGFINR